MKKAILLIGICILIIGCNNGEYLGELEPFYIELEIDCGLIQIWNESEDCIYDYCEEECWIPYGLKLNTIDESKYDFNNDSKIDPQERFILDGNIKSAQECTKECYKYPYGCFDYVMDIRCKTNLAVDKINITTGETTKWINTG